MKPYLIHRLDPPDHLNRVTPTVMEWLDDSKQFEARLDELVADGYTIGVVEVRAYKSFRKPQPKKRRKR